jgi:hypothetical protein
LNLQMTNVKNQKTALVAIAAIAALIVVSTTAIGNGRTANAFGGFRAPPPGVTITKDLNNTGVNVQTDTNQKQDCLTAGGSSGVSGSCTASSTDTLSQSGGILKK